MMDNGEEASCVTVAVSGDCASNQWSATGVCVSNPERVRGGLLGCRDTAKCLLREAFAAPGMGPGWSLSRT